MTDMTIATGTIKTPVYLHWKCPKCPERTVTTPEIIAESGTPICGECDVKMMYVDWSVRPVSLWAVANDQGTAMQEAVLCNKHWQNPVLRRYAGMVATGAEDLSGAPEWVDASGNDQLRCVECGVDGSGNGRDE